MISPEKISRLPDSPGVYIFLGKKNPRSAVSNPWRSVILYIGKAASLRDRIKSYFNQDLTGARGPLIANLPREIRDIKIKKTDSVLEALILEANLIKRHQPKYNSQEKDDKSWNYLVITKEEFPRLLLLRGKELNEIPNLKSIYGPFPHGGQLKEALKIIRKIFPYRDGACVPGPEQSQKTSGHYLLIPANSRLPSKTARKYRPCFNRQIGLCPGVCVGEISEKSYGKIVRNIEMVLRGQKKPLLRNLEKEMALEARRQNFEKAGELRNNIFALRHIRDIALMKNRPPLWSDLATAGTEKQNSFRIESYDIAHFSGKFVVGAMSVIKNGQLKKSDCRKFRIKIRPGINDPAALKEIIKRRLNHKEWRLPNLISVDGGLIQKRAAESAVKEASLNIPTVSVVKDQRHKPRQILGSTELAERHKRELLLANQEAHRLAFSYHRRLREKING